MPSSAPRRPSWPLANSFKGAALITYETPIPQIADLRGATVAILNNHWTSMNIIAEQISVILKEQYGVAEVFEKFIPLASAAPQETFDEVKERAHLAVVGLAN
jgi:hypothetical protein